MAVSVWEVAERVAAEAAELIVAVRDEAPEQVHRRLAYTDPLRLRQLVVALAAIAPDDVPLSELLAWTDPLAPPLTCDPALDGSVPGGRSRHGTRSRYVAGCRGAACAAAQRDYDASRPPKGARRDDAA